MMYTEETLTRCPRIDVTVRTVNERGVDPLQVVAVGETVQGLVGHNGHGQQEHRPTRHSQGEGTQPQTETTWTETETTRTETETQHAPRLKHNTDRD